MLPIADQNVYDDNSNTDRVHASLTFERGILSLWRVLNTGTEINRQPWLSTFWHGYKMEGQYFLYLMTISSDDPGLVKGKELHSNDEIVSNP